MLRKKYLVVFKKKVKSVLQVLYGSKHHVFPFTDMSSPVCRQQGGECRGAAGELPVGPGALQQTDPTGCQQEPAGHHLHTGVAVPAHQRGECRKSHIVCTYINNPSSQNVGSLL